MVITQYLLSNFSFPCSLSPSMRSFMPKHLITSPKAVKVQNKTKHKTNRKTQIWHIYSLPPWFMTCFYLFDSRLLAEPKEETAVSKAEQIWDICLLSCLWDDPMFGEWGDRNETVMWGGELLCLPHVLENLMCVRVLLCLHTDTYMKTENLWYVSAYVCAFFLCLCENK